MKRRRAIAAVVDNTRPETNRLPDSARLPNLGMRRFALASALAAALLTTAVASFGDDKRDSTASNPSETVLCLEIPHPDRVIDRLTDPRIQEYLRLSQAYEKFASGKQIEELRTVAGVIAGELNTTWQEGLRDLTGGGIHAEVEASPGQAPRIHVLITARKPGLLEKTSEVFLKLARQDAQQKGKPDPARTSSHRGFSITALGGDAGIAYCIAGGRLLATNSIKNLERLIDRGIELAEHEGKAGEALAALGRSTRWQAIRDKQSPDALAWSFVDLERLRKIDPQRFSYKNQPDTGVTILFGSWYEAIRKASSATASIRLSDTLLAANVELAAAEGATNARLQGLCASRRKGGRPARPAGGNDRLAQPLA